MPILRPIPRSEQHVEPWANGRGSTTVILREPDDAGWCVRVSVATVDHEDPFSELPATRRLLVPLDAAMGLRFPDGSELRVHRMQVLSFAGAPAPSAILPDGPTRDFNLMLRDGANGDVFARTLVDSMVLSREAGVRWLAYMVAGHASFGTTGGSTLDLDVDDAVLVTPQGGAGGLQATGSGEIVLVKLYA